MGKGRGLSPYVSEASPVGITPGYGQVVFLPLAPPPFESFHNSLIFSTRSVFHPVSCEDQMFSDIPHADSHRPMNVRAWRGKTA